MHGVTPLASRARRHLVSCGKRCAALPARARGLATAYAIDVGLSEYPTETVVIESQQGASRHGPDWSKVVGEGRAIDTAFLNGRVYICD